MKAKKSSKSKKSQVKLSNYKRKAKYLDQYNRAMQLWGLLLAAAAEKKVYVYGELSRMFGWGGARAMAHCLGPLMYWCQIKGYPPLTLLVVNDSTGKPGPGLEGIKDQRMATWTVFKFDWFNRQPPTIEELMLANQVKGSISKFMDNLVVIDDDPLNDKLEEMDIE